MDPNEEECLPAPISQSYEQLSEDMSNLGLQEQSAARHQENRLQRQRDFEAACKKEAQQKRLAQEEAELMQAIAASLKVDTTKETAVGVFDNASSKNEENQSPKATAASEQIVVNFNDVKNLTFMHPQHSTIIESRQIQAMPEEELKSAYKKLMAERLSILEPIRMTRRKIERLKRNVQLKSEGKTEEKMIVENELSVCQAELKSWEQRDNEIAKALHKIHKDIKPLNRTIERERKLECR